MVLIVLRARGDAAELERRAAADPAAMTAITDKAKTHGVISHVFYGNETEIVVIDEWETEEGFRAFFDASPEIGQMMGEVGVTGQPEIAVYRELATHDRI